MATFPIVQGQLAPIPVDTIKVGGGAVNLTGKTLRFSMRADAASTLAVDHATAAIAQPPYGIGDGTDGAITYQWQAGDTTGAPGPYDAWWTIDGQDTPAEWNVTILAHQPAAAYATVRDVKARAGRLAPAWSPTSTPGDPDIAAFLGHVAGEIDAQLAARGYATPTTGAAARALLGLNADGALILAIAATFPEESGPASAGPALSAAMTRYNAAWSLLLAGTHPALLVLEAGSASAPRASSFWIDEPSYGLEQPDPLTVNPWLFPEFARGQRF